MMIMVYPPVLDVMVSAGDENAISEYLADIIVVRVLGLGIIMCSSAFKLYQVQLVIGSG